MDGLILALLAGGAKVVSEPASASAAGKPGSIAVSDGYLYVCVDTDTWQRVALETF